MEKWAFKPFVRPEDVKNSGEIRELKHPRCVVSRFIEDTLVLLRIEGFPRLAFLVRECRAIEQTIERSNAYGCNLSNI